MKCAIYTRVSTDTQAEKEFSSCEAQEEKIRSFIISQNNWKVFKVYSDPGFTGANLNRPALQELPEDIKQGKIDIVLVYEINRLTRSPKDFFDLSPDNAIFSKSVAYLLFLKPKIRHFFFVSYLYGRYAKTGLILVKFCSKLQSLIATKHTFCCMLGLPIL